MPEKFDSKRIPVAANDNSIEAAAYNAQEEKMLADPAADTFDFILKEDGVTEAEDNPEEK